MEYKIKYKEKEEKESIIEANNSLFLIEEQNITEGNFLIFTDEQPVDTTLNTRVSDIATYLSNLDENTIVDVENSILEIEKNKIENGGM